MCVAIDESYLLNIGQNLPLGDLRLIMDDGEVLNEFGAVVGEVRAHESLSLSDGYDSEDYSFEEAEGEEEEEEEEEEKERAREITWGELVSGLCDTDWQPLEDGTSVSRTSGTYALFMNRAFGLHKVRATRWLCSDETSQLACLCREGVFMFSAEFEFCCLIARKCNRALGFMRDGGLCGREGPTRAAGQPYDFHGEDELGDGCDGNESDGDEFCEDGFYGDEFDAQPELIQLELYRGSGVRIQRA